MTDARYCAECFIPRDGRRPGCHACKQRDHYRRRKEQRPDEHHAYVALKSAEKARRLGFVTPFRVEVELHARLNQLRDRRAAAKADAPALFGEVA